MSQLPAPFTDWFAARGWQPHAHQRDMIAAADDGAHALLIAPTGGGKTLAGFMPSLVDLASRPREGLHTLYISPLKALSVDVHRNLETPIAEMDLAISAETRTGDTPQSKRERQRRSPPNLLLTTPESLALLLSYPDAGDIFAGLVCVVIDELHALADNKRGDQLALSLSRLTTLAPEARRVGLSATVPDPQALMAWLSPTAEPSPVRLVETHDETAPNISILVPEEAAMPWSGHLAVRTLPAVYERILEAGTTIVFVNTRAQAELAFHELWRLNTDNLAIGLHHGSLEVEQRRRTEAAMAAGKLRAVVATSSLDLGIDWGAVDQVIQVGAPKGVSRLIQRVGRAGHRLDTPSRAILVPANRFEYLECLAALDGVRERTLDGMAMVPGGLDVLAQHILCCACAAPFDADALFAEVRRAAPYAELSREDFDATLAFVAHGGYALRAYERYRRLRQDRDGRWRIASAAATRRVRTQIGTIVESVTMKVRLGRGRVLGEVEEHFVLGLVKGDTFLFAGRLLVFEGIRETEAIASAGATGEPKIPAYGGGRLPLSSHLAERVRAMLATSADKHDWPAPVDDWLSHQREASVLPGPDDLLIETFPRGEKHFLVAYCFEGRNAHQTLGMLLTRRMERAGLAPLGFVATDYVIAVWSAHPASETDIAALFAADMLGDDLEEWMAESSLLRRTFRNVAVIAGLIERDWPSQRKTRRHMTVNADLIYDVLRR
ncbi:MAG: ligase-associated DNA damage response DEXH box helicase, partial [Alphaproteobacteria bacterium]|nr:ligase-associated DNA damage response DEXH box helicase [Alphaproteobacteria bacterium]